MKSRNKFDEAPFTARLNYLNQSNVDWYDKWIYKSITISIVGILLINFDNYLGCKLTSSETSGKVSK